MNNIHDPASMPVRWGIIGCGDVTELKSGPAFNRVPGSSLVAVMRRDAAKAEDYARRHGVPKWYGDANELIMDPGVDAIYIATPPGHHEVYAVTALNAGKPVYVEKPMSVDISSCRRMMEASASSGMKLTIAHYRRALPKFIAIKKMLDDGLIGDVRTVRISMLQPDNSTLVAATKTNWRVDPAIAGAGLFYDLAPHQLDLVFYFFGETIKAEGIAVNQAGLYEAEDAVVGIMKLESNIIFSGQWCFTAADGIKEDIFEITGSRGSISFPVFGPGVTVRHDGADQYTEFQPPAHIQQPMIEKVVRYFSGIGTNPCSASDAMKSMSVMENFVYGLKQGGN